MVLKANNLFILYWANPAIVPITKDKRELNKKLVVQVTLTSKKALVV